MPFTAAPERHRAAFLPDDEDHLIDGVRWPRGKHRWFVQASPGRGTDKFSLFLCRDEAHAEELALRCIDAGATDVLVSCL